MKQKFSSGWIRSKQPRKQRKYRLNAPMHIKKNFLSAHLSKDLRKKHSARSIFLKKGDKVKVMRGQFRKKIGTVDRIDLQNSKAYVTGIETVKKDGSKIMYPLQPSNLMITDLKLDDKKRQKMLDRKKKKVK
ncbi:50S ribosomal protein L24 [Candidatus Woesearchaeota archaeon]|nr:50S ribosomal protein L24 [Candidatus Woesearchaeota archaeon]